MNATFSHNFPPQNHLPSTPHTPTLHPHHLKFLALLTQSLVPKRHARTTHPTLQHPIEPEPVPPIAAANAEVRRLAEDQVVVDAAVREGFKAD
jgi:hypothetical protein